MSSKIALKGSVRGVGTFVLPDVGKQAFDHAVPLAQLARANGNLVFNNLCRDTVSLPSSTKVSSGYHIRAAYCR